LEVYFFVDLISIVFLMFNLHWRFWIIIKNNLKIGHVAKNLFESQAWYKKHFYNLTLYYYLANTIGFFLLKNRLISLTQDPHNFVVLLYSLLLKDFYFLLKLLTLILMIK